MYQVYLFGITPKNRPTQLWMVLCRMCIRVVLCVSWHDDI